MAYRSRAHRHPAHSPHTRRPRARPAPAGRKGSDSLGWQQPEYVESWLNNADNKRGWSGSQVRLTRLELAIYRTEHFRPLAPNPSTPPRAAPRDLGRSRAISGDLGAAPRYLGRSRSVARAASHLLKKEGGWRQEVTPHPERRRRRVFGPRVVARRLLRGAADHRTARRRPVRHAPPSTRLLPHERPQRRNFSLALPWAPGNADGLPVPPPAPHNHRRDCRRCAPCCACPACPPAKAVS